MIQNDCRHTEAFTHRHSQTGDVIRKVDEHDCEYVDRRNALIPAAERIATVRGPGGKPRLDGALFFAEMDRLAINAGIMKPPGPWLADAKRAEAERREQRRTTVGMSHKVAS